MEQPTKNSQFKAYNTKTIFHEIQKKSPILRRKLQEITGLSWSAVSIIINELISKNIIEEQEVEVLTLGRKPRTLDIVSNDNFFIGIDISFSQIRLVVIDLKGRVFKSYSIELSCNEKEVILSQLLALIREGVTSLQEKYKVFAISVSVYGFVESNRGISVYTPFFNDWVNVELKQIIENEFNIKTYLFSDSRCIMSSERFFDIKWPTNAKNVIVVRIENGVSMSMLIDGEIYTGERGKAAEINHITVKQDGISCYCGKNGCMESYCSGRGVVESFFTNINNGEKTDLDCNKDKITYFKIAEYAKKGDKLCIKLFEEFGQYLAITLETILSIIDPEIILLQLPTDKQSFDFSDLIKTNLSRYIHSDYKNVIVFSDQDNNAVAVGAAIMAIEIEIDKVLLGE